MTGALPCDVARVVIVVFDGLPAAFGAPAMPWREVVETGRQGYRQEAMPGGPPALPT